MGYYPRDRSRQSLPEGRYDALASGRLFNRVHTAVIRNASVPRSQADFSVDAEMAALTQTLPKEIDLKLEGVPAQLDVWRYQLQKNRLPNSLGIELWATEIAENLSLSSVRRRTARELVRAAIAARIHELRHGQLPRSLDALVSSGLLEHPPRDFYGEGHLRYDPARRTIWSVGADSTDDSGDFETNLGVRDADFGVTF
jgi:hypothetical protein